MNTKRELQIQQIQGTTLTLEMAACSIRYNYTSDAFGLLSLDQVQHPIDSIEELRIKVNFDTRWPNLKHTFLAFFIVMWHKRNLHKIGLTILGSWNSKKLKIGEEEKKEKQ